MFDEQATIGPGCGGAEDPRTNPTNQQYSLASTRGFSGKITDSEALHKSGLCGRVARWHKTAAWSLQKGNGRF